MTWNNDHVPEIDIEYDDSEFKHNMAQIAATLDKNNFGDAGSELRRMTAEASVGAQRATNHVANQILKEVTDLMKERQYHSKSGYVGHGNMVSHTKDHVDGNLHRIYTDALAKDGYNYSQAFEFGLLTRDYPAHHPYQDTADHLGLTRLNGELEKEIDEAIKRGLN